MPVSEGTYKRAVNWSSLYKAISTRVGTRGMGSKAMKSINEACIMEKDF